MSLSHSLPPKQSSPKRASAKLKLPPALQQQWQQSREQIAANPRLGWGLWCLLLLALLYVNLVLRDSRDSLSLDLYTLQQRAVELGVELDPKASAQPKVKADVKPIASSGVDSAAQSVTESEQVVASTPSAEAELALNTQPNSDANSGLSNESNSPSSRAPNTETNDEQDDWPARLAQAKAALAKQEAYFGQADSEALARADVQANVNSLLVAIGLERSRIEVSAAPAINESTGLVPLQLKVSGQASGDQLLTLLGGLEHAKPSYTISSLNALQGENVTQLSYSILATVWYQPFEATP